MAYAAIEPFGEERADLRAGIISATIANCHSRKKGAPAFKVDQFMPKFKPPVRKWPTADELVQKMKWLNQLYGGKVKRGSSD